MRQSNETRAAQLKAVQDFNQNAQDLHPAQITDVISVSIALIEGLQSVLTPENSASFGSYRELALELRAASHRGGIYHNRSEFPAYAKDYGQLLWFVFSLLGLCTESLSEELSGEGEVELYTECETAQGHILRFAVSLGIDLDPEKPLSEMWLHPVYGFLISRSEENLRNHREVAQRERDEAKAAQVQPAVASRTPDHSRKPQPLRPFPAKPDWRAQIRRFAPLGLAVVAALGMLRVTGALATWRVLASLLGLLIFGGAVWQLALRYAATLAPERERKHSLN